MNEQEDVRMDLICREVPLGWLVLIRVHHEDQVIPTATFVLDPKHDWKQEGQPVSKNDTDLKQAEPVPVQ